jgi:sulfur-carrier protein
MMQCRHLAPREDPGAARLDRSFERAYAAAGKCLGVDLGGSSRGASWRRWGLRMPIKIELFGIARARAGVAGTTANGTTLGAVLTELAVRYPGLAEACIDGRRLRPGFTANLGGDRFVTAPETKLADGDTVLLLSLDAGG